MSEFPIARSPEIFHEIVQQYGQEPITGYDEIEALLSEFQSRLGGWIILDFLDMANWDKVEAFELDRKTGVLTLTWHDYRGVVESESEKEIREMVFPASVYACALQVNSIVPIAGKAIAVFLINGYAKTTKEIKKLYKTGADEITIMDNSFFEKRVLRRKSDNIEVIDFHCTPMFSLAIVPKQSGLGSHHSKNLLYSHNLRVALDRLEATVNALDSVNPLDADGIAEKANTVRRIMEFVLKVECCLRDLTLKKSYSQVLLGDLIATIKPAKEDHISTLLGHFAGMANEFSHDSGKPIELDKAKLLATLGLAYTSLIELEHRPSAR
jgi:hypothetical protein